MKQSEIKTAMKNRDVFDYKKIFLAGEDGTVKEDLVKKFPTKEDWFKAHAEDTKHAFADIDTSFLNRPKTQERILEIGEKVFDKVQRVISLEDPIPMMFHTKSYGIGEKPEIHDVYGGRVYERAYGAYARMSRLTQDTYTLNPFQFAIHIAEPLEQLQSGRITVADITFAISQAVLARRVRFAYDTFISAYGTNATYTTNVGGALDEPNFRSAVRKVAKFSDVNQTRVIGNYVDVVQVADFNNASGKYDLFSDEAKELVRRQGALDVYSGAVIIPIKYWADDRYGFQAFEAGSIFVISNELGWNEFAEFGDVRQDTWVSPGDGMVHYLYVFNIGAAVWKLKYGHRLYGVTNSY